MDILTEATLRSACPPGECAYAYPPGTFVTDSARQYAKERGIRLEERGYTAMTGTPPPAGGAAKPEAMTHLRAGVLTEKTDPRIRFRGKMDSFQAELLCLMTAAAKEKRAWLVRDLGEVLRLCRDIMAAEVRQTPLADWQLMDMTPDELHALSHKPPHPVPDHRMGETAMALNRLRTHVRELELDWLAAYAAEDRPDIVLALNRLSSALYLLFRKEVKNHG